MTAKPRIVSVIVHRDVDTDADLSYLGEYKSSVTHQEQKAGKVIDREERGDMLRGEYRYWVACNSGEETGNPASVEEDYQRCEDYNRMEWCMAGIWAEARIVLAGDVVQKIRSGGLWGIESDSDKDYFAEVEKEELSNLREQLRAVGFDNRTITTAFKRAERKEYA